MKKSSSGFTALELLMSLVILAVVVLGATGFCIGKWADPSVATRTLESGGYSNIQIIDHSWFVVGLRGCDVNDTARFTVRATNPAGKQTEMFVCSGTFFKGGTIRVQ